MNIRNPILIPSFLCALCCLLTGPVYAQIPRINTLFPIGGKTGTTVEVELRGASLAGAEQILVTGKGVAGSVSPDWAKSDDRYKPVWQSKCGSCHELRSPANRSLTPAQWAATVDRMVRVRNAPLSADEINKVTQFLSSGARVGKVVAKITIADDAQPGIHELRALTPKAISTACFFEVGSLPEITAANGKKDQPQRVTLPCVANGCMTGTAERHFFQFTAKKAQRYVFNLKGFRYSEPAQMYFNPNLRLYDQTGKEIMENHGYYDLDPVIDWTCSDDGDYTLEVRDLLGRGNPGSVYRLTMGPVANDASLPDEPSYFSSGRAGRNTLPCVMRPDNVSIRPGLSTAVEGYIRRGSGLEGDVEITAEGLPPGVTALPAVIPADRTEGRLILSASPDAKPSCRPFKVIAIAKGSSGETKVQAVPQELYRINNDPRTVNREESIIAVCGQSEFTASMSVDEAIRVHPRKGAPIKVSIRRNDNFKGPVNVRLVNLPTGWTANPETARPNQSEITLLVRPDGNNTAPFLNRDPKQAQIRAVLEAGADEFYFAFGSAPVQRAQTIDDQEK